MKTIRDKNYLLALLVLLAVFAACKGESPTAPSPGGGGGSTTPPLGSTLTLTAANPNPQVSTQTTVTASATTNGSPVPNGTAVEFSTNFGTFAETGTSCDTTTGVCKVLRTTTNGVATVTLTSSVAGSATVQAVVNNVLRTTTVTFSPIPQKTCPPDCPVTPTSITSISPAFGNPAGGTTVTITGVNLKAPVRVFFTPTDPGATPKEAFVVSRTDTQIVVTSPPINLGTGQTKAVDITVVTQAGTSTELPVKSPTQFTYQLEVLTPTITTISPASGPIDGGTNVVIFGDGFQAPVQVFVGSAEARVLTIKFKELTIVTPAASATTGGGSGVVTGPVDIKVININSNKSATSPTQFRYVQKAVITSFGPTQGPAFGGQQVTIDGAGFNDPVAVSIGGISAQPIRVSATEIVAITGSLLSPCAGSSGPVIVTNVDNGDSATSVASYAFIAAKPIITNINPKVVTAGNNVTVTVANPGAGLIRFLLGTDTVFPNPGSLTATQAEGPISFVMVAPTPSTFPSVACTVSGITGTQQGPAPVAVTFTNVTTSCTDTVNNGLSIGPSGANLCVLPPQSSAAPANNTALNEGSSTVGMPSATTRTVTFTNNPVGGASVSPLTVSAAITGTNAGDFAVNPASATINSGNSTGFTVTFTPTATGARSATLTFTTNDPAKPTYTYPLSGTGL